MSLQLQSEAKPLKAGNSNIGPLLTGRLLRKCCEGKETGSEECEECRKKRAGLQRFATGKTQTRSVPGIVHEALRSPGQPLETTTRAFMESRFNHNFSKVRVHADAKAAESARAVNALAYTMGADIVFGAGEYAPATNGGNRLLAHELTHVVQQSHQDQRIASPDISDPTDRDERNADAVAVQIMHGELTGVIPQNSPPGIIHRTPQTWYRGEARGVTPASPGGVVHDFGDGFYLTNDPEVAAQYAALRAADQPVSGRVLSASLERSNLGRVLDLTQDARWQQYMETRSPSGVTFEQLIRQANENYWSMFRNFLTRNNLQLESFDTIIGPEYQRGGIQVCIRNPSLASQVRSVLQPVPPSVPTEGAPPAETPVRTTYRVLSTQTRGGNTVSELEVSLGEGLEHVNQTVTANGARALPSRLVLRITTNAQGALVGAESTSGESTVLVETLARQALATIPRATTGAEGAAAGMAGAVSPWVRGVGWAGVVIFVGITAYQYRTAPPEQRPRILATAGGGLAGGMVTSYLICNAILGIETLGWSLLICAFVAGIPGGLAGSAIAGEMYDEATATPLQRAFHTLEEQPTNVRRLFYGMVDRATSWGGLPVTEDFIRGFMITVPTNLADDELATLTSQMSGVRPGETLTGILAQLHLAISQLPRRRPILLPPMLHITDIMAPGSRGAYRVDALGSGRIRLLPAPREPNPLEMYLPSRTTPTRTILEFDL